MNNLFLKIGLNIFLLSISVTLSQHKVTTVYDYQVNSVSNVSLGSTNYGIYGLDVPKNIGAGFWPRGSENQYIFGAGFWFGCQKKINSSNFKNLVEITYNPSSGKSWFVPGRIEDGDTVIKSDKRKYQIYFSTDYNPDGTPKGTDNTYNWCQWFEQKDPAENKWNASSEYIDKNSERKINSNQKPFISSDEDIISYYKDTDLGSFEDGALYRKNLGYPIGLQVEQKILTFSDKKYKDAIIINYKFTNKSKDTLYNCTFAPVLDLDIATYSNSNSGSSNDRVSYYFQDTTLDLGYMFSDTNRGEAGKGFGYIGSSFIRTPIVNDVFKVSAPEYNFLDKDQSIKNKNKQLGLKSFRNWIAFDDKITDLERWNFITDNRFEGDFGASDRRILMSTNFFHMRPNDSIYITLLLAFALPAKGGEADGTTEDLTNLVKLVKDVKAAYYNPITNIEDNNQLENQSFSIKPNPSNEFISFDLPENFDGGNIKIINILGECVLEKALDLNSNNSKINISNLSQGFYTTILSNGQINYSRKLVIGK